MRCTRCGSDLLRFVIDAMDSVTLGTTRLEIGSAAVALPIEEYPCTPPEAAELFDAEGIYAASQQDADRYVREHRGYCDVVAPDGRVLSFGFV